MGLGQWAARARRRPAAAKGEGGRGRTCFLRVSLFSVLCHEARTCFLRLRASCSSIRSEKSSRCAARLPAFTVSS